MSELAGPEPVEEPKADHPALEARDRFEVQFQAANAEAKVEMDNVIPFPEQPGVEHPLPEDPEVKRDVA